MLLHAKRRFFIWHRVLVAAMGQVCFYVTFDQVISANQETQGNFIADTAVDLNFELFSNGGSSQQLRPIRHCLEFSQCCYGF